MVSLWFNYEVKIYNFSLTMYLLARRTVRHHLTSAPEINVNNSREIIKKKKGEEGLVFV